MYWRSHGYWVVLLSMDHPFEGSTRATEQVHDDFFSEALEEKNLLQVYPEVIP